MYNQKLYEVVKPIKINTIISQKKFEIKIKNDKFLIVL